MSNLAKFEPSSRDVVEIRRIAAKSPFLVDLEVINCVQDRAVRAGLPTLEAGPRTPAMNVDPKYCGWIWVFRCAKEMFVRHRDADAFEDWLAEK